jgi:rRNA-processing protein FCF1
VGGATYKKEVKIESRSFPVLVELKRKSRIINVSDDDVDRLEKEIKAKTKGVKDFDDHHIVALVIASGCCVVCTKDERADKFLKNRRLYPNGCIPKIYRSAKCSDLCCDDNVAPVCR